MTNSTRESASAKARKGLSVVDAPIEDGAEVIESRLEAAQGMMNKARLHSTPPIEEEVIESRRPIDRTNAPRLSIGACIRENRSYQRTQKIKRAELRLPAADEIGYKKLFTRFEEAFTTQDITMLRSCLSPAFQWHLPNGQVVYGREEALSEMERRFAMLNGPRFSASVWRFKDTTVIQNYDVEFLGSDGRWRQSKGMDLYEIGDGLITRKDAYWKMVP